MSAPKTTRGGKSPLRSGFVTLVGRPNAGKSTLVNALVGRKVAIVTPHPQTTRTHLLGVVNLEKKGRRPAAQIVLVDTPGVHKGRQRLHRELLRSVRAGLEGRDLCLLLVDVTRPAGSEDALALEMLASGEGAPPTLLALNKIDKLEDKRALLPLIESYRKKTEFVGVVPISGLTGENLELLRDEIVARLPAGPAYFEPGQLTDQPEHFLIAEVVREKAMLLTREEIPHSLAVKIEADTAEGHLRQISAAIICERTGQKAVLVGKHGAMIRAIGTAARQELEPVLGSRLYLTLQILVRESWRQNPAMLEEHLSFRH